jgi:hypothetical protein
LRDDFLDILTLMSFVISLENLDLNVTQEDAQNLEKNMDEKMNRLLNEIHAHLKAQDKKIDEILKELKDDKNKRIS